MNRIQIACCSLIGSAMFLSGALLAGLGYSQLTPEARGDMVIAQQNFSLMTAQTRTEEEGLFVLDNKAGRLLIYRLNLPREQFELKAGMDLGRVFGGGGNTNRGGGR